MREETQPIAERSAKAFSFNGRTNSSETPKIGGMVPGTHWRCTSSPVIVHIYRSQAAAEFQRTHALYAREGQTIGNSGPYPLSKDFCKLLMDRGEALYFTRTGNF